MHGKTCLLHGLLLEMEQRTLTQQKLAQIARLFLWAEAVDFTVYLTGEQKRFWQVEYNLPKMVEKGALRTARHGRKLVYTLPSRRRTYIADIEHGLICTKALLRFKAAQNGEFVGESYFRSVGFKAVPEWAVIYPNSIILFEYSTADNFRRRKLMHKKLVNYQESLDKFERHFEKRPLVLFVYEAKDHEIRNFLHGKQLGTAFYFTDLDSFVNVAPKMQLKTPIYTWSKDWQTYPLCRID